MPNISTLVDDMNNVLKNGSPSLTEGLLSGLGSEVAAKFKRQLTKEDRKYEFGTLYASDIGRPCVRELWYKYRNTDKEPLSGSTVLKFLYGDIIEDVVLHLATLAGHEVKHQQAVIEKELSNGWRVRGRIDAVIDDALVDVKSVASQGFYKFESNLADDPFGYRFQLGTYSAFFDGCDTSSAGFLCVDKSLGHVKYYDFSADIPKAETVVAHAENCVSAIEDETPPPQIDAVPSGTSGNLKLCTTCSYCGYKETCWANANDGRGLQAYQYSNKVELLVKVVKEPKVDRIK
jgi:hypothetical protein